MRKVLVTGATGFLGSHLVVSLQERNCAVVALCRDDEPELEERGIAVVRGDVLDEASVRRAADGCDGGFHCAGKVSRKHTDAEELYRVHVEGTRTVLLACKRAAVKRVVIASTSGTVAVSGDPRRIANEDDDPPLALLSRWPYYRAKYYAERAALDANGPDLEVVSVNPTLLLGPGDFRGSSTGDVRLFLDGRIPAVPSGGLSYVDVRDAAEAMLLAMDRGEPGRRYLVGACNLTFREFFGRLSRVSGVGAPWLPLPRAGKLTEVGVKLFEHTARRWPGLGGSVDPVSFDMARYYWYLDATRAQTVLGWRARDPVETLADTVNDVRARAALWPMKESLGGKVDGVDTASLF